MTREKARKELCLAQADVWYRPSDDAIDMAIEALEQVTSYENTIVKLTQAISEQEPLLDKIRAEITNIPITDTDGHNNNWYREPQAIINDVLQIIDKYRAESEEV